MKKLLFILAAMIAGAFLFAEDLSMKDVFDSLTSSKVTAGDFVQEKTAAKLKRPLKSSGKFIFSDQGIVWQTLKPFPVTMVVTKSSIIQTRPDGSKLVTDGSSSEVFKSTAQTLSSLFSGNQESLEQFFKINSFDTTADSWKMELAPKDKTISAALKSIELGGAFRGKKASLDLMKILQNETEAVSYTLSNQVYRQELTDAEKALFK